MLCHVVDFRRMFTSMYLYSNRNPKTVNGISRVSPVGPKTVELYSAAKKCTIALLL
jgi:hypothetical protein